MCDFSQRPPPWPPDPPPAAITAGADRSPPSKKRRVADISDAERLLGKLAETYALQLQTQGWDRMVRAARGRSNIAPSAKRLAHKAARLLNHLGLRGASVMMTAAPWSRAQKDHAMLRGPHQTSHGERAFVSEEMMDFCNQGYRVVLPSSGGLYL